MKTHNIAASSRGMALLVVMGSLVFLAALALAFLASVGTELQSSKAYSNGGSAKQLGQVAANLVMAQISEATRGVGSSGNLLAWASQPGMIRTYNNSGNASGYYKLYSWDQMTGTGAYTPTATANAVPANWGSQTAVFTDLNAPLQITSGGKTTKIYPIIDGNDLKSLSGHTTYSTDGTTADIDGFYITSGVPVQTATSGSSTPNPIPMPVKWLYVLQDGTIVAPTPGSDGTAVTINGASKANPIVGRIAFWTDDETCKVNINTASEGTYADSPRCGSASQDDIDLSYKQPVNGEYQRYPGHPAMTSLSVIFHNLTKNQIYGISPRYGTGGSVGATVQTVMTLSSPTMQFKTERLYPTIDELLFAATLSGSARTLNNSSLITKSFLRKSQFMLTASSRSPELNLFGRPRVCIWPISSYSTSGYRTSYDNAIAFCSTINKSIYYFQRKDSTLPSVDLPSGPSTSGLGRNRMLLAYLKNMASKSIPGFGGKFSDKYSSIDTLSIIKNSTTELDQILTEIFDYIRCTNLNDSSLDDSKQFTAGNGTFGNGKGQAVPIEDPVTGTRGFGRYVTVQGANLLFIGQADENSTEVTTPVKKGYIRVQSAFLPQLFNVAVGSPFCYPRVYMTISGLQNLMWDNGDGTGYRTMSLPSSITPAGMQDGYLAGGSAFGAQFSYFQFTYFDRAKFISSTLDFPADGLIKFTSGNQPVTFSFRTEYGSEIQTVKLLFPDASFPVPLLANPAYSATLSGELKTFNLRYFDNAPKGTLGRFNTAGLAVGSVLPTCVTVNDVIRSVSASPGDIRLISVRKNTATPEMSGYPFAPNPYYYDTTKNYSYNQAHNMCLNTGHVLPGSYIGKLVKDATYSTASTGSYSDIPLNGVALGKSTSIAAGDIPGDWDNGVFEVRDGPYINKPDEGDRGYLPTSCYPYKWSFRTGNSTLSSSLFSPNRLISSAVMFGSLPSGVLANKPWQTLQFRPGPAGHPGLGQPTPGSPPYTIPPDHLLLDLFTMPVVEPYVISEPLSQAGKINMNYQIVPFTYINRDTGIRAVLKSEKVVSIKTSVASTYKITNGKAASGMSRQNVDVDKTLAGFTSRFLSGDIFRSPCEICDIDIVPSDYTGMTPTTRASMDNYWSTRLLTGDNSREHPYATIYPRFTTQSNTYTVYYRVQTLKKTPLTSINIWDESIDKVTGEYRGSQLIERYIDPNNTHIPDYADPDVSTPISSFYKFRILQSKQFAQ